MREILFRGKRIDNGKWIEGMYVIDAAGNPRLTVVDSSGKGLEFIFIDPGTVGQYTGFNWKDQKLFRGDILRLEEDTDDGTEISYLVVEWIKEWGLWATLFVGEYKGYQDQGTAALDESMIWTYTLENTDDKKYFLCGNIHDKPELLK